MKYLFTLILSFCLSTSANAQNAADAILGIWHSSDKDAIFEFFKQGNHYASTLLYGDQVVEADGKTSKKDQHNPDPSLRSRDVLGIVNIRGLQYKNGAYVGGKIYDARSGKFYKCKITIKDDVLHLRGYLGIALLGKTTTWVRATDVE